MKHIDSLFMRLAVAWFIVGLAFGIGMAASGDHAMFPVHAHINLLGWVSMALFGAFYRAWPQARSAALARWHFWLYAPAHFVMMVALGLYYRGVTSVEPVLGISSIVLGIGALCFAVLVWQQPAPATQDARASALDAVGIHGSGTAS